MATSKALELIIINILYFKKIHDTNYDRRRHYSSPPSKIPIHIHLIQLTYTHTTTIIKQAETY